MNKSILSGLIVMMLTALIPNSAIADTKDDTKDNIERLEQGRIQAIMDVDITPLSGPGPRLVVDFRGRLTQFVSAFPGNAHPPRMGHTRSRSISCRRYGGSVEPRKQGSI
jgi:hypothetical protein